MTLGSLPAELQESLGPQPTYEHSGTRDLDASAKASTAVFRS